MLFWCCWQFVGALASVPRRLEFDAGLERLLSVPSVRLGCAHCGEHSQLSQVVQGDHTLFALGGRGAYLRTTGVRRVGVGRVGSRARVSAVQRIRCVDAICHHAPADPQTRPSQHSLGLRTRTSDVDARPPGCIAAVRLLGCPCRKGQPGGSGSIARCLRPMDGVGRCVVWRSLHADDDLGALGAGAPRDRRHRFLMSIDEDGRTGQADTDGQDSLRLTLIPAAASPVV